MFETIKAHPYITASAIGGFLLLVVLLNSSGGNTAAAAGSNDATASGDAYNNMLAQVNGQIAALSIQAGAAKEHDAAQLEIAKLSAGVADNANTLAASVAMHGTDASRDVAVSHDTLSAHVADLNQGVQLSQLSWNAQVKGAELTTQSNNLATVANALTAQSANSIEAIKAAYAGQAGVAAASQSHCTSILGIFSTC